MTMARHIEVDGKTWSFFFGYSKRYRCFETSVWRGGRVREDGVYRYARHWRFWLWRTARFRFEHRIERGSLYPDASKTPNLEAIQLRRNIRGMII